MEKIDLYSNERWKVIFNDDMKWRVGIYVPENKSLEEISYLEAHNAPELFLLLKGKVNLVISEDLQSYKIISMEKYKIYIVNEWHNAFRIGDEGIALVVERSDIATKYEKVNIKDGRINKIL